MPVWTSLQASVNGATTNAPLIQPIQVWRMRKSVSRASALERQIGGRPQRAPGEVGEAQSQLERQPLTALSQASPLPRDGRPEAVAAGIGHPATALQAADPAPPRVLPHARPGPDLDGARGQGVEGPEHERPPAGERAETHPGERSPDLEELSGEGPAQPYRPWNDEAGPEHLPGVRGRTRVLVAGGVEGGDLESVGPKAQPRIGLRGLAGLPDTAVEAA